MVDTRGATTGQSGFKHRRRRPSLPLLVGIAVLHVALLYGLGLALAPDLTASVEEQVVSAFTVTVTAPPTPPPPENQPEPDEGAQGDPGKKAVPQPVTQPKPPRDLREDKPRPRASSTGAASQSGAAEAGAGTGAAGSGLGTGSGNRGGGRGGVAVTRPVHISGSIDNARDFPVPPGGRGARRGTEVIVRVTVGTDGRAHDCTIYRPSPDPEADRITCQLVESRLGFRPAMDSEGNPVAAPFYWRQRWF
ncbi:energy transducer TonB [Erythrobacter tepidarius]|uniref:energy transducer TonB n=1 Tax=Erythrobacter tepidarius TaxID=60454 RepID=UPI001FE270EA|nr:energy transducer TonB [Erythrobacter tepidarius]